MLLKLTEEQRLIEASVTEVLSEQYTFAQRIRSLESAQGVNPVYGISLQSSVGSA